MTGIDSDYCQLITSGAKVFGELSDFDMVEEFRQNYEANRKVIFSLLDKIDEILQPKISTQNKSRSSGCMFLAIVMSTSMLSFFGIIISLIL